ARRRVHPDAAPLELVLRRVELLLFPPADRDFGAELAEGVRDRQPDAAPAARDEGDLSVEEAWAEDAGHAGKLPRVRAGGAVGAQVSPIFGRLGGGRAARRFPRTSSRPEPIGGRTSPPFTLEVREMRSYLWSVLPLLAVSALVHCSLLSPEE